MENNAESRARLILDYIRTLLWPVILVIAVVAYKDDVFEILKEREIEVAGLRIGQRVSEVKSNFQAEMEDLRKMVEELAKADSGTGDDAARAEHVLERISGLERNLQREFTQIQEQTAVAGRAGTPALTKPPESREQAGVWEGRGFAALLNKDVDEAIAAFEQAKLAWPDYHNVAEIERFLQTRRNDLAAGSTDAWKDVYQTILTRFSWGMPTPVREQMRAEVY